MARAGLTDLAQRLQDSAIGRGAASIASSVGDLSYRDAALMAAEAGAAAGFGMGIGEQLRDAGANTDALLGYGAAGAGLGAGLQAALSKPAGRAVNARRGALAGAAIGGATGLLSTLHDFVNRRGLPKDPAAEYAQTPQSRGFM